jgi:hypothetical protein
LLTSRGLLRRKCNGAKVHHRSCGIRLFDGSVGERCQCVEAGAVRPGGALRSENAGMSSDNPGENPGHRKPKVSYATLIGVGLVGPKAQAQAEVDGQ